MKQGDVSEFVCMFVCSITPPKRGAEILRDDSPWDWEGFRLKNTWIRRTVSWKITFILAPNSTLAVDFILFSMNFNVFGSLVGVGEINK